MRQLFRGFADSSKPNAGRIYDYLLGGHHNFEIDRQAAQQIVGTFPFIPHLARLVRWFLGEAIRRLCEENYTQFLDFASGLPTVDHIHEIASKGTKVIYSDIDPVTVAYGKEIVSDNSDIRYVQCDAAKPQDILESGVAEELFGSNRKVAIGFNGISWFISDESVAHSMKTLYEWADTGSKLFICDIDIVGITDWTKKIIEYYNNIGQSTYQRPKKELLELVKPWKVEDPGFQQLDKWVDVRTDAIKQAVEKWGGGGLIGAILVK